jgi:hypothetical protein
MNPIILALWFRETPCRFWLYERPSPFLSIEDAQRVADTCFDNKEYGARIIHTNTSACWTRTEQGDWKFTGFEEDTPSTSTAEGSAPLVGVGAEESMVSKPRSVNNNS